MPRSRLYVLDGTSGVWKRELLTYLAHTLSGSVVVRKLTTRSPRTGEDFEGIDLQQVSKAGFTTARLDYTYEYGGEHYGFSKGAIHSALREYEKVFIIVRNAGVIKQVAADYYKYCPTTAFVYVDSGLGARKAQEIASPVARTSIENAYKDYLREPELYDAVLVHGDEANDLFRLVNVLISRGSAKQLLFAQVNSRFPLAVACSAPVRAVILSITGLILGVNGAFIVNIATSGAMDYWKWVSLVLAVFTLLLGVMVNLVFLLGWERWRH